MKIEDIELGKPRGCNESMKYNWKISIKLIGFI